MLVTTSPSAGYGERYSNAKAEERSLMDFKKLLKPKDWKAAGRTDRREQDAVRRYGAAMIHQLEANRGKGDWAEIKDWDTHVYELLYHVMKLVVCMQSKTRPSDPIALQEFAADVGNHAMFIADNAGVLERTFESDEQQLVASYLEDVQAGDMAMQLLEVLKTAGLYDGSIEPPSGSG